jgi:hypothetical protein
MLGWIVGLIAVILSAGSAYLLEHELPSSSAVQPSSLDHVMIANYLRTTVDVWPGSILEPNPYILIQEIPNEDETPETKKEEAL